MRQYTREEFAKLIDHTGLDNDKDSSYFDKLCQEALDNGFKMVAINSSQTKYCSEKMKGTGIHVGAAISFPLGQTTIATKTFETKDAINSGADEIDYVVNVGEVKNKNWPYISDEMRSIVDICKEHKVVSKVIFENALLTNEEIIMLSEIAKKIKPDFIKTSTGKLSGGAKVEDILLMKNVVMDEVKVKASGGIRSFNDALKMIEAGAERIGCSQSVKILKEFDEYLESRKMDKLVIL